MNQSTFHGNLARVNASQAQFQQAVLGIFGRCTIERAGAEDDKLGIDYWMEGPAGRYAIDEKSRGVDYLRESGKDDLALEVWSVVPDNNHEGSIGWSRDREKKTDLTIWHWRDTDRIAVFSFPHLLKACLANIGPWYVKYQRAMQASSRGGWGGGDERWRSECVFVPRAVLQAAIDEGCPKSPLNRRVCRRLRESGVQVVGVSLVDGKHRVQFLTPCGVRSIEFPFDSLEDAAAQAADVWANDLF